MTMPHLMNCSHSPNGWCLDCVKELWEETHPYKGRIKILTEAMEKAWNDLGRLVLDTPEPLPPLVEKIGNVCDEIGEALNDANPELEGVRGPSRGLYSPYQPLEVVRFVTQHLRDAKPKIEPKQLPDYQE